MSKFKVGDRVVCVYDVGGAAWICKGELYTIESIPEINLVKVHGNSYSWHESRFEYPQPVPVSPQYPQLNTPITDAVAKIYEAVLTAPEAHRHSVLRAVMELL